MAGYFIDGCHLDTTPDQLVHIFHVPSPTLLGYIKERMQSRVLTVQLDGDELDAFLWGISKYDKAKHAAELAEMYEVARLYAMAQREFNPRREG